jgi:type VI protein secretion system component Hcp
MNRLKKTVLIVTSSALVASLGVVGIAALVATSPVSAQITDNEQIFMTTTQYGTNTNLAWWPAAQVSGAGCATVLAHATEVNSVSGGMQQTLSIGSTSGAGAGKVSFNPFVITKKIDTGSAPFEKALATGTPFNVQLYFFHVVGDTQTFNCAQPDMRINLVLAAGSNESIQVPSGNETITLQYGLEALRTATPNSDGVNVWDANGGFCWNRVKNISCSAIVPPTSAN